MFEYVNTQVYLTKNELRAILLQFNHFICLKDLYNFKNMLRFVSKCAYRPSINFKRGSKTNFDIKQLQPVKEVITKKITVREALNTAMDEEIANDQKVFLIGEEIGAYDGAYKITKGLYKKYGGKKVVDTPIVQTGFTGLAIGAALMGLKPIVQFMSMSFSLQSIDQIINSAVKLRYMSAGEFQCPIVFRGLNGPTAAAAAQHSQCMVSFYSHIPGIIVLAPYDAEDARGLLKSAVRNPNPVIILENENLYGQSFSVSQQVLKKDFLVPIGKAKIMKKGKDATIVAFSRNVKYSLEAAQQLQKEGISCQVINLRTIRPLDRDTIVQSIKKTGRLITVEDGFPQSGVGSEIIALINQTVFDYLKGPAQRVTSVDVPMPYCQILQSGVIPRKQTIIKAVKHSVKWN